MPHFVERARYLDRIILLFLFAVFLLISPLQSWWAADDSAWYTPYLLWFALLLLAQRLARLSRHDL